jgi:hypothetical protein
MASNKALGWIWFDKKGGLVMTAAYQTFLASPQDIPEGQEIELVIKDLTPGPRKYDGRRVKAIVYKSSNKKSEGDTLWVRSEVGVLHPQPWKIKIIERLPDLIPVPPYSDYKLRK